MYFYFSIGNGQPVEPALRSACDDPSGGRRPAQIPQLNTPHASKELHISTHNRAITADACCFIVMAYCSRRSMNPAASETRPGSASPPAAQNIYTTVAMSNVQPSVTSSDVADTDHTLIENDLYEREGQGHGP